MLQFCGNALPLPPPHSPHIMSVTGGPDELGCLALMLIMKTDEREVHDGARTDAPARRAW
jgi:hypothetical protein